MRTLHDHETQGLESGITIEVKDKPGIGGANHSYIVRPESRKQKSELWNQLYHPIKFQEGPPSKVGHNGVTNEALLAIVIDRLRGFQSGKHGCQENGDAIDHLETALDHLHQRTRDRLERGVEGTYAP